MSICNCNQGRLPCTCKPIEGATVMSEVSKFHAADDFTGELCVLASDFDRVTAERDALQERLNAADQKDDDLSFQLKDREGSRRDWFEAAQAAEKRVEELKADIRFLRSELRIANDTAALGVKMLAERDALLENALDVLKNVDDLDWTGEGVKDDIEAALSASAEPSAPVERDERAECELCGVTGIEPCTACAALIKATEGASHE